MLWGKQLQMAHGLINVDGNGEMTTPSKTGLGHDYYHYNYYYYCYYYDYTTTTTITTTTTTNGEASQTVKLFE